MKRPGCFIPPEMLHYDWHIVLGVSSLLSDVTEMLNDENLVVDGDYTIR